MTPPHVVLTFSQWLAKELGTGAVHSWFNVYTRWRAAEIAKAHDQGYAITLPPPCEQEMRIKGES